MTAKKILLLGATGGTGRQILSRALADGCEVTALVRDPARLAEHGSSLRVLVGSLPGDEATLSEAVRGQDAVVSALGVGTSLKSNGLIRRSMPAIVRAMETEGVRRFLLVSAYGVGNTREQAPVLPRIFMRLLLRDLYADKKAGEDVVEASGLDWTVVQPVTLTDGPPTGRYRAGERLELRGFPRVSRADVADFVVGHLDDPASSRRRVLVSS